MSRSAEARYELKNAAAAANGLQVPLWNAQFAAHQATISGRTVYPSAAFASAGMPVSLTPIVPLQLPRGVAAVPGAISNYVKADGQQLLFAAAMPQESEDAAWRMTPRIETYGNEETFNLNPLLANCVLNHEYCRKLWEMGDSFPALLEEARGKVTHVEPWQQGTARTPSTAFCILVRLFQLGLHEGHVRALLRHNEKPVVRCLGYLYLRYVLQPAQLWKWCEAALHEDVVQAAPLCGGTMTTVSAWLRKLLTDQKYYGTILPRIPVKIEREIKVKMMLLDESVERAKGNERILHKLVAGAKVRAIYGDENNEPAWYDAVIDAVERREHKSAVIGDGAAVVTTKFWVTFPEYGNQELVRLGDVELIGGGSDEGDEIALENRLQDSSDDRRRRRSRSADHDRDRRRRSDRRRRDEDDDHYRSRRRRRDDDERHNDTRASRRRRREDDDNESRSRRRRRDDDEDYGRHERRRRKDDENDVDEDGDRRRQRRKHSESPGEEHDKPLQDSKSEDYLLGPRTGESLLAGDRMQRVLQQQRDAASAVSDYARRPQGYKEALALKIDRYTRRDRNAHGATHAAPSKPDAP